MSAGGLILKIALVASLILRRQRSLLPAPRRLACVPLIADTGGPLPLARPIGIIGLIKRLRAGSRYDHHPRQRDGSHRASHGYPPVIAAEPLELTSCFD